jgi:hypothetical protein
MERQERLNIIIRSLEDSSTFEGRKLLDEFSPLEIVDVANHLVNILPDTLDEKITKISERLFVSWNKEIIQNHCKHNINTLLKYYIQNKLDNKKLILLITYLSILYKLDNISITKDFDEIQSYFESLIITSTNELVDEVNNNPINANTLNIRNYYIRVIDDFIILPTLKTKENFISYLIH